MKNTAVAIHGARSYHPSPVSRQASGVNAKE